MYMRIGKVTNIYPAIGKIKVLYEDEKSASLPLSMLSMNDEYSMPAVGEKVVTVHMANGSSKGFVLGTYYSGEKHPKANSGYRKDFGNDAYVACVDGKYLLKATNVIVESDNITLKSSYGELTVEELMKRLERIEEQLGLTHTID